MKMRHYSGLILTLKPIYLDFRMANHFTNASQMLKWDINKKLTGEERQPAQHHLALVLNDIEYRKAHGYKDNADGSHFDESPVINRVEIILDLSAFFNSQKNAILLLQALYQIVLQDEFNDHDISSIIDEYLNSKSEGSIPPAKVAVVEKAFHPDRSDLPNAK